MDEINIALITDKNYIMQTYITISSIIESKEKNNFINIHVITMDVNKNDTDILKSLSDNFVKINVIPKNTISVTDLANKYLQYYSPAIFIKLELEKLINCKKLLLLDSDIIIKKDLTDLYNIKMDNYYIAGIKDVIPIYHHLKSNGILYNKYFNVGVMLLNLELIRKENFFDRAITYYLENGQNFEYPEQDTLNQIIGDKLKLLSPKYNWIVSNENFLLSQLNCFYGEKINKNDITVIHYAGEKPWKNSNVCYFKDWYKYYKNSPFYNTYPLNFNKKHNFLAKYVDFIKRQISIIKNYQYYKKINIIH